MYLIFIVPVIFLMYLGFRLFFDVERAKVLTSLCILTHLAVAVSIAVGMAVSFCYEPKSFWDAAGMIGTWTPWPLGTLGDGGFGDAPILLMICLAPFVIYLAMVEAAIFALINYMSIAMIVSFFIIFYFIWRPLAYLTVYFMYPQALPKQKPENNEFMKIYNSFEAKPPTQTSSPSGKKQTRKLEDEFYPKK